MILIILYHLQQEECKPDTCTQMTATEQWIFLCAAHKTPKEVSSTLQTLIQIYLLESSLGESNTVLDSHVHLHILLGYMR